MMPCMQQRIKYRCRIAFFCPWIEGILECRESYLSPHMDRTDRQGICDREGRGLRSAFGVSTPQQGPRYVCFCFFFFLGSLFIRVVHIFFRTMHKLVAALRPQPELLFVWLREKRDLFVSASGIRMASWVFLASLRGHKTILSEQYQVLTHFPISYYSWYYRSSIIVYWVI